MSSARVIHPRSVLGPDLPAVPYSHPLRAEFHAWLSSNGPEGEYPLEQDDRFAYRRAWQRSLAAGGWAGIGWPIEYGGRGAGSLDKFMYYEELALAGCPEPANTPGILLLGPTLMEIGTPELRSRFLPKILAGDEMWAQCFSEPDSGSDLASLRTKARLDGEEWVIDGSKTWSTFAQYADFAVRALPLRARVGEAPRPDAAYRPGRAARGDHPPDRADQRRRGVLRGLPRRRPHSQGLGGRRGRPGLVGGNDAFPVRARRSGLHRPRPAAGRAARGA